MQFERDGPDIRLVETLRVPFAAAPPNFRPGPGEGPPYHFCYEVLNAHGEVMYRVVGSDPTGATVEFPSEPERGRGEREVALERARSPRPTSRFTLLVPELPGAASVRIYSMDMDTYFPGVRDRGVPFGPFPMLS